jgi:c(7)-type cytochrome triheme protein
MTDVSRRSQKGLLLRICRLTLAGLLLLSGYALQAADARDAGSTATALPDPSADQVTDPANESEYAGELYKMGLGWHPAAMNEFEKDKYGLVDWVKTLNDSKISPRGSVDPKAQEMPPFDMNIIMPSKTGMIEGAYFPHKAHTQWLDCQNCHTKIFIPRAGANDLTMSSIVKGKACGVCHGKVAFPLNDCERCHVPQAEPVSTGGPAN